MAGDVFQITVTAKDNSDNTVTNLDALLSDRTFSWSGLSDSPEGSAPIFPSSLSFTNGVATANITAFKAENLAAGAIVLTDSALIQGASTAALEVSPRPADRIVFLGSISAVADNTTPYELTIESRDPYGNLVPTANAADSNLTLNPIRASGLSNVGPLGGSISGINLQDNSSVTISDLTYQVAHTTRYGFTTAPSISIDNDLSTQTTWEVSTSTVAGYDFTTLSTTALAGSDVIYTLTARDAGGNVIVGEDTTLNSLNFEFSTDSSCDGPEGNHDATSDGGPSDGNLTFINGQAQLNYRFYNTSSCLIAGDIEVQDTTNGITINNSNMITITPAEPHHFATIQSSFPANADSTAQVGTSLRIELRDLYGNLSPGTSSINGNLLSFIKVSGYGDTLGTMTACGPAFGAGCDPGQRQEIEDISLNFDGVDTLYIYDLAYDVGHVTRVLAEQGSLGTNPILADEMSWNIVNNTLDTYSLSFTSPQVVGTSFNVTVRALDQAGNTIVSSAFDTILSGRTFSWSGFDPSPYLDDPLADTSLTFSDGEATASLTLYEATTLAISDIEISDSFVTGQNDQALVLNPEIFDHFAIVDSGGDFIADGSTAFSLDIETRDEYGNLTTNGIAGDFSITAIEISDEPLVDTIGAAQGLSMGGASQATFGGLTYRVSHEVDFVATRDGDPSLTTPESQRLRATFAPHIDGIERYEIRNISNLNPGAGTTFTADIHAIDYAGNTATGLDATFNARTFTFSTGASDSPFDNSPIHPNVSTPSGDMADPQTFVDGVSSGNRFTLFNAETIAAASFTVSDGAGISGQATEDVVIAPLALHEYNITSSVSANIQADAIEQFDAIISARDEFGNITQGDSSLTIAMEQTDAQTNGVLRGSVSGIDLSTGEATISDLTYRTAGTAKIVIDSGGSAAVNSDRSFEYTFDEVERTIDRYELSFSSSQVAGVSFDVTVEAVDEVGNTIVAHDTILSSRVFTWSPDNDSPYGDAAILPSTLDFTLGDPGVAIATLTFRNAETIGANDLTLSDNATPQVEGESETALTIVPHDPHRIVFLGNTSAVADNQTTYSLTIESRDQYGNPVPTNDSADNSLDLIAVRESGYSQVGSFSGDVTGIDLENNATVLIDNLTYQVAHEISFAFDSAASLDIDTDRSVNVNWTMDRATVASYDFETSVTSETAGVAIPFTLTARDGGGNIIDDVSHQGVLGTINFSFVTSADCDGPEGNHIADDDDPTNDTKTFIAGVTTLNYFLYHADPSCGQVGDLEVEDEYNSIIVSNDASNTLTITPAASHHFATFEWDSATNTFPFDADGEVKANSGVVIELRDEFGNPRTDNVTPTLSFVRTSGYGNTLGDLQACGPVHGLGCDSGERDSIGNLSLDFNASEQQIIYDLSYDVGHEIEILASEGGLTTASELAQNFSWTPVAATIARYTFEANTSTVVAGEPQEWTITAYDHADNLFACSQCQTVLNGLEFTVVDLSGGGSGGNFNGPSAGVVNFPENISLSFSSDTAEATLIGANRLIFYHAGNDIGAGEVQIADNQTPPVAATNEDPVTVESAQGDYFTVTMSGFDGDEEADHTVYSSTEASIELFDEWGNPTTDLSLNNVTLAPRRISGATNLGILRADLDNSSGGTDVESMSLNFSSVNQISLYNFSYNVAHEIDLSVSQGGVEAAPADSDNITWNAVGGTVASYELRPVEDTAVAGEAQDWDIFALDAAGNVITDTGNVVRDFLNGLRFTLSTTSGDDDFNGPEAGTVSFPNNVELIWDDSTGSARFEDPHALSVYNAAFNVPIGSLTVEDNQGSSVSGVNVIAQTVTPAAGDHFHIRALSGFPAASIPTGDTSTEVEIELHDEFGNPATDSDLNNVSLSVTKTAGAYTLEGDLMAATTNGGTQVDVDSITLDFSAQSSHFLYDFISQAAQTFEIVASQGGVTTAPADNEALVFNVSAQTPASYTLTLNEASTTAGVATTATLEVFDAAGNKIDQLSDQAALGDINFTFAANAQLNSPYGPETAQVPANGTKTFSGGQVTLDYTFYAATTVEEGWITIVDTTNGLPTIENANTMVIDQAAVDRFYILRPDDAVVDTEPLITVQAQDEFGNRIPGYDQNVTLNVNESATGGGLVTIVDGEGSVMVNNTVAETVTLSLTDSETTGLDVSDEANLTFTHGPLHSLRFVTQPVANQVEGQTFATVPVVELLDEFENRAITDDTSSISLTAFTGSGCSTGASGSLTNHATTAVDGLATFSGLHYSAAEEISLRASSGGAIVDCSNTTEVFPSLSIETSPITTGLETVWRIDVFGGVPSVALSFVDNQSGASLSAPFTGGDCPADRVCWDYTSGDLGGGVIDEIEALDSATPANSDSLAITVNGAIFSHSGDSPSYGVTEIDVTHSFDFENIGNETSGSISISLNSATPDDWEVGSDGCSSADLAPSQTCQIGITFLGNGASEGVYNAEVEISSSGGASYTLELDAEVPTP